MPSLATPARLAATLALVILGSQATRAEDLPPPKPEGPSLEEAIKPRPPAAIPDDPPPHEGALIDIPYVIEPPDILVVEVLEALPGRPITGEHLVRQDGTISLGFYGTVYVRGLTPEQAKLKVILQLRPFLTDESLGLARLHNESHPIQPLPKPGTVVPLGGQDVGPKGARPVPPRANPPPTSRGPNRRPRLPLSRPRS